MELGVSAEPPRERLAERYRQLSRHYELVGSRRVHELGFGGRSKLITLGLLGRIWWQKQFLPHYFDEVPRWRLRLRQLSGRRTLPDFFLIGTPKGGSSDLGVKLLLHPNVLAPLVKECWNTNPEVWRTFYPTEREKQRHAGQHGLAMSPLLMPALHWMEFTYAFSRIQPRPRVVLTLREPVARVFSQWKWEILLAGKDRATRLPFLATFRQYVDKMLQVYPEYPMFTACGYSALQTSIYWKAVRYWLDCFGQENVLVLNIEDYFTKPDDTLRRIQEFVGLPYVPIPAFDTRVNENPLTLPPPDGASVTRLREFFRPHNEKLWSLIGQRWSWA